MSNEDMNRAQYLPGYIIGTIIFVATLAAWLYAESHHIATGAILGFAIPVIGALFLTNGISNVARDAKAAATQTNGTLENRIEVAVARSLATHVDATEAAVTRALASRDQVRTWQVVQQPPLPTETIPPTT